MKKVLILLGIFFSVPLFSQICVTYPIGLPVEVNVLKEPNDYLLGTNNYKVVSFELKAEGYPRYISLGNDLKSADAIEYLSKACPDGCFYLVTRIGIIDEKGQKSFFGGLEGPFPYVKYSDPKK